MTKNELQDAFMESLSLDEGNRNHKKMLYGNPDVATTDILLELLFDDYDIIGNSEWLAKVIKFNSALSKSHIYHLSGDTSFYLQYYKYMVKNNLTDTLYDVSEGTLEDESLSVDEIMRRISFRKEPIKSNSLFANTHNNRLIAATEHETLVMMDAFFTPSSMPGAFFSQFKVRDYESKEVRLPWVQDSYVKPHCLNLIESFVSGSRHCQSNQSEKDFYKDVYGITFT